MDFVEAQSEVRKLLKKVKPSDVSKLLKWMKTSGELAEAEWSNSRCLLKNISEDLRARLPPEAMFPSEELTHSKIQQCSRPTLHVDAFLYSEEEVDALCDDGTFSRSFCTACGSHRTSPLDFISHSFSIPELHFLFHSVLPDLSSRTLVDVGSRLGSVLYAGHVFSSASQLIGLEISEEFVKLQNEILQKYKMTDRIQAALLQRCHVLIMNNVFEFFMEPREQVRAWRFIMENFRNKGSLLVTVPSLQESLSSLQEALQPGWVEELPVDYDAYLDSDGDPTQIHLYRVV